MRCELTSNSTNLTHTDSVTSDDALVEWIRPESMAPRLWVVSKNETFGQLYTIIRTRASFSVPVNASEQAFQVVPGQCNACLDLLVIGHALEHDEAIVL